MSGTSIYINMQTHLSSSTRRCPININSHYKNNEIFTRRGSLNSTSDINIWGKDAKSDCQVN